MAVDDAAEDDQLASMATDDIVRASRLLDNEVRVLKVRSAETLKPRPPSRSPTPPDLICVLAPPPRTSCSGTTSSWRTSRTRSRRTRRRSSSTSSCPTSSATSSRFVVFSLD
jgi:hypothetical protein